MIIGIGGVSRAGKTTLAEDLCEYFKKQGNTVDVFCQDKYVKPTISIPKVQGVPDWERPSTIKWERLTEDVQNSTADIKIVEGLFAFYPASLRTLYNASIFINIDKEVFLSRKKADSRWGKEPSWYAEHVWRSYLKYGQKKGDREEYIDVDGKRKIELRNILAFLPD